jgi:hypothetical protein
MSKTEASLVLPVGTWQNPTMTKPRDRTRRIVIRLTPEELAKLKLTVAAHTEYESVSAYVRWLIRGGTRPEKHPSQELVSSDDESENF